MMLKSKYILSPFLSRINILSYNYPLCYLLYNECQAETHIIFFRNIKKYIHFLLQNNWHYVQGWEVLYSESLEKSWKEKMEDWKARPKCKSQKCVAFFQRTYKVQTISITSRFRCLKLLFRCFSSHKYGPNSHHLFLTFLQKSFYIRTLRN